MLDITQIAIVTKMTRIEPRLSGFMAEMLTYIIFCLWLEFLDLDECKQLQEELQICLMLS